MAHFVLVHGAFHGAWCWKKLATQLERRGARVAAPDLSGMGQSMTPAKNVTFDAWVADVREAVLTQADKVILVGHSMGGFVVSGAAERCADNLLASVYISAALPGPGSSIAQTAQFIGPRQVELARAPREANADGTAIRLAHDADIRSIFYNTCSEQDVAYARAHLGWQPILPFQDPIPLSEANYGRVPRVYVECLRDQGLPLEVQREVQAANRFDRVIAFDTDHSPFFCNVPALAAALIDVSRKYEA